RCCNPAHRIISDLIEHRIGLLGDLIDRHCHVITSPDYYRSSMVGSDQTLQWRLRPQHSGLFKEKLAATQKPHSARETRFTRRSFWQNRLAPVQRTSDL